MLDTTVYAIQYEKNRTPMAIGTITEEVYKMIYNECYNHTTVIDKLYNRLEKTITTDNYTVYKLARELHRKDLRELIG